MKRKMIAITMLCLWALALPALAGQSLEAWIEGNTLYMNWQAAGQCELTVYRDGWPMFVSSVSGSDGGTQVPVGNGAAAYSVRLKSAQGISRAEVSTANDAPVDDPEPVYTPVSAPAGGVDGLADQVVTLTNEERAKAGLSSLRVDGELTRAACVRAGEIVRSFSHTRPDGSKWSTVSASAFAENIARGQRTADKAIAAWMTSSTGHRQNILRPSYGSIGVCVYRHDGVTYWVQLFGK